MDAVGLPLLFPEQFVPHARAPTRVPAYRSCLALCRCLRWTALHILRSTPTTVSAPTAYPFRGSIHTPRDRCVRFVFGIIGASRNTRVQAARYALPGRDLHRLIAPAWLAP